MVSQIFSQQGKNVTLKSEFDTGFYIVDIYVPELKLVIEIDGIVHYKGSSGNIGETNSE
jgi:very-short-patch-repair endonuclease